MTACVLYLFFFYYYFPPSPQKEISLGPATTYSWKSIDPTKIICKKGLCPVLVCTGSSPQINIARSLSVRGHWTSTCGWRKLWQIWIHFTRSNRTNTYLTKFKTVYPNLTIYKYNKTRLLLMMLQRNCQIYLFQLQLCHWNVDLKR